jgi:hypothetical protein
MFFNRLKLSAGEWLVLGLFLGVLVGIGFSKITMEEKPKVNPADIPRRLVTVTIAKNQQEELFVQLRKFADKWRYAIRIAPTSKSGLFRVDMWRSDIHVGGVYSDEYGTLQVAFNYTESRRPVPDRYFTEEVDDLKTFIDEIPNATFTVSK